MHAVKADICYIICTMTKLLKQAVAKLSKLPQERQNELARMLIDVAASDLQPYRFTNDERAAIDEAMTEIERGEFASEKDVAVAWERFGL